MLPRRSRSEEVDDEKALYQIERDWAAAVIKNDVAAIDKILATEFQSNYVAISATSNSSFLR
jgi:hypothetical protein